MTEPLDGNSAAGAIAEVLTQEMTAARTICAVCGDMRPLGELQAYMAAPGIVLRCATCEAVQLRLVRTDGWAWLDLRGIRVLEIKVPAV